MEPVAACASANNPKVIELVIEETEEYEITWGVQIESEAVLCPLSTSSRPVQFNQLSYESKSRPIARVLPAIRQENPTEFIENDLIKKETEEEDLWPELAKSSVQDSGDFENEEGEITNEVFIVNNFVEQDVYEENESIHEKTEEFNQKNESKTLVNETPLQENDESTQRGQTDDPCAYHRHSAVKPLNKQHTALQKDSSQETIRNICSEYQRRTETASSGDPCDRHRDCVRKNRYLPYKTKMDCEDGQGCENQDQVLYQEMKSHEEKPITDCLDEFLQDLHLGHLLNYLKVLGCMCVRDLRLLELPELNAIQLISRRRLLQHLNALNLHHEAPPADCSLEAWLTWYGLTHISGFLTAIGVHSVGDLQYLSEDDLLLLKPVTRRRLLACHKKNGDIGRKKFVPVTNDYLM